ncbi:hypothetical protein Gotur_028482, partial [Gossypium turneri]
MAAATMNISTKQQAKMKNQEQNKHVSITAATLDAGSLLHCRPMLNRYLKFAEWDNQPIMGNPAIPYAPNQPVEALGAQNMQQPVRENLITLSIPNQQLGALAGGSFLNQSLLGNGNMTSNVQFEPQQRGVIGSTSVGQPANNVPSRGQANQMPAIQNV